MTQHKLFQNLSAIDCPAAASQVVREFGQAIEADRCFLYVRHPATRSGLVAACWLRDRATLDLPPHDYEPFDPEPDFLHTSDPMFVAALSGTPATFVTDVRDAGSDVNAAFEEEFNHRSLVHINLNDADGLWGILQPAMNHTPRNWTDRDRALVAEARMILTPLMAAAMASGPWTHAPRQQLGIAPAFTFHQK
jgi:GAF domain-containing protein